VRLIGEGGMGSVYEAEQEHPRRTVALKVIKPGLASPALLRRFDQEAEALGRLQHPGIAQIYEAGTADTGFGPQPYFAMELIRGVSLKEYARERGLSTRQRVEMMGKVCDAVQHAHQKGLIHRDLKPANILVDETGQPKIVDFGVARITDRDAQATSQTDAGQLIGTLAYMSPEQVLADPLELDTRSDVYTLGVILYELLAGRLPYAVGAKLHEALQAIRESDPQRLSSVDSVYRGDLETIAAKALEKDKVRRYASAAELGADLRRYLTDEPIVARPPSVSYQFGKFARRHHAVVAGVAAVFVVLVAGIVVSTLQAARANRERDRAAAAESQATQARDGALHAENVATGERDRAVAAETQARQERDRAQQERDKAVAEKQRADNEAAIAAAVSEFLRTNLLEQAVTPIATTATPDVSVRAILTRAVAKIEGKYAKQPLVEAAVHEEIATAFASIGASAEAASQLERSLELRRRTLGAEDLATARTMHFLGMQYLAAQKFTEAERTLREAYKVLRDKLPDTLYIAGDIGLAYMGQGKPEEALSWEERALSIAKQKFGPNDDRTIKLRQSLDSQRAIVQRNAGAAAPCIRIRVIAGRPPGSTVPPAAETVLRAQKLLDEKAFDQAEKLYLEAVEIIRQGGGSLAVMAPTLGGLARAYEGQGKYAAAEKVYLESLELTRKAGSDESFTLITLSNLARVYERQGKYAEQEATLLKAAELARAKCEEAPETQLANRELGVAYIQNGKYAEAQALFENLTAFQRRTLGDDNPQTRNDRGILATDYALQRKFVQSEDLLHELLDVERRNDTLLIRYTLWVLGWVHLQSGRAAEAELSLREALSIFDRTSPEAWERFNVQSMLGMSLAAQHKYTEAEPLLLSGYEGMKEREPSPTLIPTRLFDLQQAGQAIAKFYQDSGQTEKAVPWQNRK
jgi:tetratricopeptide (TPR) repeat protein